MRRCSCANQPAADAEQRYSARLCSHITQDFGRADQSAIRVLKRRDGPDIISFFVLVTAIVERQSAFRRPVVESSSLQVGRHENGRRPPVASARELEDTLRRGVQLRMMPSRVRQHHRWRIRRWPRNKPRSMAACARMSVHVPSRLVRVRSLPVPGRTASTKRRQAALCCRERAWPWRSGAWRSR